MFNRGHMVDIVLEDPTTLGLGLNSFKGRRLPTRTQSTAPDGFAFTSPC